MAISRERKELSEIHWCQNDRKISETNLQKKSENFKMSTSYKCLNSQILGLVGFFKNSRNTMGVVYFRKALGKIISKMMISVVKFKNVKILISVSTLKFWGWLGFSKSQGGPKGQKEAQRAKGGPKGLRLEVGARRAPKLLVFCIKPNL